MLQAQTYRFERSGQDVRVYAQIKDDDLCLCASLLIGADGAESQVARWMEHSAGIRRRCKGETIPIVTADVVFLGCRTDSVEIFVGNSVAPGWFGWSIPTWDGMACIGVGTVKAGAKAESPQRCFEAFLDLLRCKFDDFIVQSVREGILQLGPAHTFTADQVMLVGAAARQTKPTTGGGIYFGIRGAQLAAETAINAIRQGDCSARVLVEYEQAWHRLEGRELLYGHWLRKGFRHLSDSDFDLMINALGKPRVQSLISRLGDIDFPSKLFVPLAAALCKQPALESIGTEMDVMRLVSVGT